MLNYDCISDTLSTDRYWLQNPNKISLFSLTQAKKWKKIQLQIGNGLVAFTLKETKHFVGTKVGIKMINYVKALSISLQLCTPQHIIQQRTHQQLNFFKLIISMLAITWKPVCSSVGHIQYGQYLKDSQLNNNFYSLLKKFSMGTAD